MALTPNESLQIWIVDDDAVMRELLPVLLEAEGHFVRVFETSATVLNALQSHEGAAPQIILTDLRLPATETVTYLRLLRQSVHPVTFLLGMSGSPAQPDELSCLDAFLLKPFSTDDFHAALRSRNTGPAPLEKLEPERPPVLDEATHRKLAQTLPPAQLAELYRITLDDVRSRLRTMRDAANKGELATCRSEAHAIKGGCGMVGAAELRALAAAIETGALLNTPAFDEIEAACNRLERMLKAQPDY